MFDRTIADALGLALCGAPTFRLGERFAALRRRVVPHSPGARPCLAGAWNGCDVLVLESLAPNAYEGDELVEHRRIHAFAGVDPPSVLGFSIERDDGREHQGLAFPLPGIEPPYAVRTHDPALERLATETSFGILAGLPRSTTVFACDSAAVFTAEHAFDVTPPLRSLLDDATDLARILAEDLRPFHESAWHRAVGRSWSTAADAHGLDYDARRFRLDGNLAGLQASLVLAAEPDVLVTSLALTLPPDTTFPFLLTKQADVPFFDRILPSQDLRVGDRAFDEAFVVRAVDRDATRGVLSKPGVATAMFDLAAHAESFSMDARSIAVSWQGAFESAASVEAVLARATVFARALSIGPNAGTGPYR